LLDVAYRRLTARPGPGAGRPAKLYRRTSRERAFSAPARDYAQAARIFAEALERSGAEQALYATARERGFAAGRALRRQESTSDGLLSRQNSTSDDSVSGETLVQELAARGYEPAIDQGTVRLRNCPYHAVAEAFPVVACGMNLALLEGLLDGAGLGGSRAAQMDPQPGACCVTIISKTNNS
jgi:predicted ArsR family transcriptional regulator